LPSLHFFVLYRPPPRSTLFPYTTLFRSIPMSIGEEENRITLRMRDVVAWTGVGALLVLLAAAHDLTIWIGQCAFAVGAVLLWIRSEEHTSELQSRENLVCRLLLEKKKK